MTTRWQQRAACRGMDPELFFPGRGESTREAKAACAQCPVRDECLSAAYGGSERFGIWGGLSERERRVERRGLDLPIRRQSSASYFLREYSLTPHAERQRKARARRAGRVPNMNRVQWADEA